VHAVLVVVGLALASVGYAVQGSQPVDYTRAKAVGLVLFVVGEILLFGEAWWWALIGFAVPPLLVGVLTAVTRRG
jgi:hypothetical protein